MYHGQWLFDNRTPIPAREVLAATLIFFNNLCCFTTKASPRFRFLTGQRDKRPAILQQDTRRPNAQKLSASGSKAPLTPYRGLCPLDPRWGLRPQTPLKARGPALALCPLPCAVSRSLRVIDCMLPHVKIIAKHDYINGICNLTV